LPSEVGHAVQRVGGDVRFGGLAFDAPGVQAIADDRLPAPYLSFDPGSLIVAGRGLSGHPVVFGDMLDMLVPLPIAAGNSVLRRRDDDIVSESGRQAI
jgi:hypothetical protein